MKVKTLAFILIITGMLFSTVDSVFISPVSAQPPASTSRVLILPFSIQSDQDLSFLQSGIQNMLRSRLSLSGKVELVDPAVVKTAFSKAASPTPLETALQLGNQASADYVLTGTLTIFGDSVSTDAAFLDVAQKTPALAFSKSGEKRGDAISHVNLFATRINQKVFGYRDRSARTSSTTSRQRENAPDSGYAPEGDPIIWKSRKFKTEVGGLAVGDVDADGKNETVFASDNKIYIYRFIDQTFEKRAEIPGESKQRILSIDVADLDNNQKAEIYVTSIMEKNNLPRSYVLEWNGTGFVKIASDQNWFFRIIDKPGLGKILLGQKKSLPPNMFDSDIFQLKSTGGDYIADIRQEMPRGISIYGFTYGDIFNDGVQRIVAFKDNDCIMILNPDGREEWVSSESYGGSASYLEYPSEFRSRDTRDLTDHLYLKQRLYISDLDRDGKNDLIIVNNHEVANRLFSRFRLYDSGYIECLSWNTLGLQKKWRTQKVSGYISTYNIADLNNDGVEELVFSVVSSRRNLMGSKRSFIVSYDRNSPADDF